MPIIDLQRRIAEAGRIRLGVQVSEGDRTRPAKLETLRFTSPDRRRLEAIAARYGGEVRPWQSPAGPQWEVITQTAEVDIIVPPAELAFSQWYELWSASGCVRRCDGATEQISDGPCLCDPNARECDVHTRLSVLLRDIPGLGVWRLDTQGWYAARELEGAVELLSLAAGTGRLIPARLRIEQRAAKRTDKAGKVTTRRFVVPVLDLDISPAALLAAGGNGHTIAEVAALPPPAPPRPAFAPVPPDDTPPPSIAEQSQPPTPRPLRQVPIPPSGRRRGAPLPPPEETAPAEPEQTDEPAPAVEPLSASDLIARLGKAQVRGANRKMVADAMAEIAPGKSRIGDLTDEQRGRVWAAVEAQLRPEEPADGVLAGTLLDEAAGD